MAIEISAPVAGVGGASMLIGGGILANTGRTQMLAATSLSQFATPSSVLPALRDTQAALGATDEILGAVQGAMQEVRLPGQGLFKRIPFIGGAADDLERAARMGAAARELARIDETAIVGTARQLNGRVAHLVTGAEADVLQLGVARAGAISAGTKLLIGGGLAAAGVLLLATSVFDVGS